MKQLSKIQNLLFQMGGLFMFAGAASFMVGSIYSALIFVIGSVLFAYMQLAASYEGKNVTIQRLRRQQLFSDVCLISCGILMLLQTMHYYRLGVNVWVICLLIGALVQLYTSIRIPSELKKEQNH